MADRPQADAIKSLEQRIARLHRVNRALLARSGQVGQVPLPDSRRLLAERTRLRTRAPAQLRQELENTQRSLREAEDSAREAQQAKAMFLATMSHELRTPLNGMIGMLQVVLQSDELPASLREDLGVVLASADNLQLLLNDILDFARLESGRLRLTAAPFDVHTALEDVVELFAEAMQSKGLELVLEIDDGLPARVEGDEARLRQILMNLLSNAAKFTARGEVVVRAESPESGLLRFSVRDTGPGIRAADVERLFQPFMQSDGTMARRHGGTGLGLAICRELCRLLGGGIWVSSRVGEGTEFWFTAQMPAVAAAERLDDTSLAGRELWIVDPNPAALRAAAGLARRLGLSPVPMHSASECRTGLGAAADGRRNLPDFVLIDAAVDDCAELAAALAQRHPAARVVLATTVARRAGCGRELPAGVAAVVSKPLRSHALRDALVRVAGALRSVARAPAPIAPIRCRPARVLVAEDNPVNQRVAARSLRLLGLEVDVAASGNDALTALANRSYDLVLMDWMMPDLDGCEATRVFRRTEPPDRHLPIIAMTANAMPGDREICLDAGMDDYLTKPLRLAEVRAVVARWLGEADA
jgi:signal transduction histidine kinase/CheY-like chemotaxis protein